MSPKNKTSAERIHSLYLFSVLEYCVDHPYKQNPNFSGEGLLKKLKKGSSFSWDEIERGFPNVIRRVREYAIKHGLDPKTREAARGYWLIEHNTIIDNGIEEYGKMPYSQKESCKTRLARVMRIIKEIQGTRKIEIEYDGGLRREAVDFLYGDLKVGDYISTHEWIVSEKFSGEEYQFYLGERKKHVH